MLYLFGAKKMQTSAKKACFQFAECSFSYAKRRLFLVTSKVLGKNVERGIMKKQADLGNESRLLNVITLFFNCAIIDCAIEESAPFTIVSS